MIYIIIFCRNRKTQLSDLVGLGSDGCCVRLCHGGASSAPKGQSVGTCILPSGLPFDKAGHGIIKFENRKRAFKEATFGIHIWDHLGISEIFYYIIVFEIPRKAWFLLLSMLCTISLAWWHVSYCFIVQLPGINCMFCLTSTWFAKEWKTRCGARLRHRFAFTGLCFDGCSSSGHRPSKRLTGLTNSQLFIHSDCQEATRPKFEMLTFKLQNFETRWSLLKHCAN